ncbi:hypothetical protein B0H13DRAFT_2361126 [Mycena leptocephala]|nr:hypothetical protein B0H13DRAFT_2361126 [Mycena leptocephala]
MFTIRFISTTIRLRVLGQSGVICGQLPVFRPSQRLNVGIEANGTWSASWSTWAYINKPLMALHKVFDDALTPAGVKSTFTVAIPKDPASQVPATFTGLCGWGCQAAYGRLTFHTEVKNLLPLEDALFYKEFDLPDNRRDRGGVPLGVYMHRSDSPGPVTIAISVAFPAGLGISLTRPLDERVETALADTIRGDEVVDVKFYAYTRAGSSYVARPRPMFAKMALLRGHSDILDAYLSGISGQGFAESQFVDLDAHVVHEDRFTDYEYMSDSDLDTDDEEDGPISGRLGLGPIEAGPTPPDSIPLPSTNDEENLNSLLSSPSTAQTFPDSIPVPSTLIAHPPRRLGRAVTIKGHAYKTWNALLYYLYTKKVVFRALKSTKKREFAKARGGPLECSPKSMYKLADAFGLTELKALALASLKSQLSAKNIVREAFSSFTSVYTDVQDIETAVLIQHLPSVVDEMEAMLRSICDGTRPQCFNMLDKVVFRDVTKAKLPDLGTFEATPTEKRSRSGSVDSLGRPW